MHDDARNPTAGSSAAAANPPATAAAPPTARTSAESELAKERTFGGVGVMVDREIRCIDLSQPDQATIDDELWQAASEIGFFQVSGHGIPQADVDRAFDFAARFFELPADVKARRPMRRGTNSGWEYRSQNRPSTGTYDDKESYQITRSRMVELDLWPTDDELADFVEVMSAFEAANWSVAMRILSSFARKLGFDGDFFTHRHDPSSPEYQSTLRLLHYLPLTADPDPTVWRAGAHTDYDCLTLLHQVPGQRGLQVCPGSEAQLLERSEPLGWTDVEPAAGTITCNIGDMLMRWSDDQLPSTLHRVRMPGADEPQGPRYSIAYFAQADRDAVIESPSGAYPPITAADYLGQRIAANFRG
ncbi:MAG: 2OG-Fe(II) oxygenase family protein [Acidimicrobiales bacterium]